MTTSPLQQHIEQLLQQDKRRSFSTQWQGEKIWIKQQEQKKNTVLLLVTKLISTLSTNPLYYPSIEPNTSLSREALRLKLLRSKGFRVPKVLLNHERYLVMTDIGHSLKYWLTNQQLTALQRQNILMAAAASLAELHQHHRWHGRPALRDLCWDGEQIGFIDFEEDPHQLLSIDQCMVRDVLIFVHGLYRYLPPTDPAILLAINEYQRLAPARVWRETLHVVTKMWITYPCLSAVHSIIGKDGKQAYYALKQLRQLNKPKKSTLSIFLLTLLIAYVLADQFD